MLGAATSQISYTASKGGVLALSRELGRRVRPAAACASTRCARGRSTRRCCASCYAKDPDQAAASAGARADGPLRARAEEIASAVAVPGQRRVVSYVTATAFLVDGGISGAYVDTALSRFRGRPISTAFSVRSIASRRVP